MTKDMRPRIDLRLSEELYQDVLRIATDRLQTKLNSISGKPELTPAIAKLLELGIRYLDEHQDSYQESQNSPPQSDRIPDDVNLSIVRNEMLGIVARLEEVELAVLRCPTEAAIAKLAGGLEGLGAWASEQVEQIFDCLSVTPTESKIRGILGEFLGDRANSIEFESPPQKEISPPKKRSPKTFSPEAQAELAKKSELTGGELAELLGVAPGTIVRWKRLTEEGKEIEICDRNRDAFAGFLEFDLPNGKSKKFTKKNH